MSPGGTAPGVVTKTPWPVRSHTLFSRPGAFPPPDHSVKTMSQLYAGTSGWAYPSWKPDFYPAKLAAAKFLGYYANRLNSVELNYTFRRFPTQKLLAGWMEATPPDFKFAVKAHQTITHIKRLRDTSSFTADFLGALEPLREAG